MTGVIAAVMAALLGAASVLGAADCGPIIQEAEKRIYEAQLLEEQRNYEEQLREEASGFLIAIDAGHQEHGNFGQEPVGPGASSTKNKVAAGTRGTTTGVPEYQLTLDISLKLRDILEEKGYRVLMIRETNDVNISNAERAQMANEADADAFIRIHANGSDSASANGAMTICQTPSNPYNSEYYGDSRRLSDLVLDAYTESTGIRSERVWETDTMTGINWCTVPVTILELGYMTNPDEDRKMQDPEFQDVMADGIAAGIEAFLEEKKEEAGQNTEVEEEPADTAAIADTAETAPEDEPASTSETGTATETESAAEAAVISETAKEAETESAAEAAVIAETASAAETASTMSTAVPTEIAPEIEPETDPQKAALAEKLMKSKVPNAYVLGFSSYLIKNVIVQTGEKIMEQYNNEWNAQAQAQEQVDPSLEKLEMQLNEEIGQLSGNWSLYLRRLDNGQAVSINADKPMVAASLIKLFVAGEFYRQVENGTLSEDGFGNKPDIMINVSDNDACNTLINAVGMSNVNEFAKNNGFEATELNRRMLEFNGTENYTSAKDCGVMLEKVLKNEYVSAYASERILEKGLKAQQRRSKIPAGVPSSVQTANKTGELSNVDNDAAIIWSPACTYILVIMSSDTGNRIPEIVKLSSMVYKVLNE